jgi:CheY-like chemotaxis protein
VVYIVDDDIDDLDIIQEAFAQYDLNVPVMTFHNGETLIDKLLQDRDARPDLILIDLTMPIKDGFDAMREIKSHPLIRTIPVMVLTGSINKEDEIRCFDLGCNFFFRKPNSMNGYEPIIAVIEKVIGKKT